MEVEFAMSPFYVHVNQEPIKNLGKKSHKKDIWRRDCHRQMRKRKLRKQRPYIYVYAKATTVNKVKAQKRRWLGYIIRMPDNRVAEESLI